MLESEFRVTAPKDSGSKTQGSALAPLKAWFHRPSPKVVRKHKKVAEDASSHTCRELDLPRRHAEFGPKKFAVSLLRAGAEIEHSLAVQYLYAAYSIDETSHAPRNLTSLEWKTHLRLVAREEMAHLVTVQNLLLALGQEAHLNRGPMHRPESKLPLPFKLEPLNQKSLGKFVLFESPTDDQINHDDEIVMKEIKLLLGKHGSRVLRVGSIYAALYWLFLENNDPDPDWPFPDECVETFKKRYPGNVHLKDQDFIPLEKYQDRAAHPTEWGVFERSTHVDGASPREIALASLRWIMSQGEGPNAIEDSHFCRFLKIYREFKKAGSKSMIMKVPVNPRIKGVRGSRGAGRETGTLITNHRTELWGALFNFRYQLMLLNVVDSLAESRKTLAEKRRLFARWAAVEMEFMKKIGQALPRLELRNQKKKNPSNDKLEGPGAGAPFQGTHLAGTAVERGALRRRILLASANCISALRDPLRKNSRDTNYMPAAAIEPSLLDTIARQDDEMRSAME
jgi:Ferritin-like